MTAGVQHDDRCRRQAAQTCQHLIEADAVRLGVVIGIVVDGKAGALKQCPMVLPARIADPDLRFRDEATQQIGTDLERTGTAKRLHSGQPLVFDQR